MAILPIAKFKEFYSSDEYHRLFQSIGSIDNNRSIQACDGYIYDPIFPPAGWVLPSEHRLYRDRVTGAKCHFPISAEVHPLDVCENYEKNKLLNERIKSNLWRSAR